MARINIRAEVPADTAMIRAVHESAFKGREEADIVDALRVSGAATLSLVAELEGRVIGHVLFAPVAIDGPDGRQHAQGLAPVAVLPEVQRSGVGSALVRQGLAQLGESAGVVVLGEPAYYGKFGFRDAREFGLAWEVAGHEAYFQARGAFHGEGIVRYRPEVMGFQVRRARPEEFGAIQALELAAAKRFKDSTHPAAADLPPLSTEVLARASVWVVCKGAALAAYVAWEPIGADAYVIELDVHPDHAGARLGAALLDHVALVSGKRVLLRTFSDVPWNAPHYGRLGFREIETPASLAQVVRHESENRLDLDRRVTMARSN